MNQNERACHLDICGIDIPKELNDALAAGKLVVLPALAFLCSRLMDSDHLTSWY